MRAIDLSLKRGDLDESWKYLGQKIPVDVLLFLTAWLVLLFVPKSSNRMPKLLRWYEDANYGLNGDPYWMDKYGDKVTDYWVRLKWVTRNANVYDHERGVRPVDLVEIAWSGDPRVGNRPLVEGELAIHAWDKDGTRYWLYTKVKRSFIPGRCYRSVIGWKLKDALDEYLKSGKMGEDPNQRPILPAVYSVNPIMGYELEGEA